MPGGNLEMAHLSADPLEQFSRWYQEAEEAGVLQAGGHVLVHGSPE